MSFIRPEAQDAMIRWRESLIGGALIAVGVFWITGPGGLLGLVGWVVALAGLALAVVGFQRARFRMQGQGPGVVQIDEGQITYFGPLSGGAIATAELDRLTLDPTAKPAHWVLSQVGQPPISIPVNAEGADALFDVFSALPGLRTERMLAELHNSTAHPVVIWERVPSRPEGHRLH